MQPAIHSFKRTGFFYRIRSSHPVFRVGWFVSRSSCSHPFIQGLYGPDSFWQQLATYWEQPHFWKSYLSHFHTFKEYYICTFHHSNYSHPSCKEGLFCHRKSGSHPFFEEVFILMGNHASKKRWFQSCVLLRVAVITSTEYSQPFIFSTVLSIFLLLKLIVIHFCKCTLFECITENESAWNKLFIVAATFSELHELYWNESCYLN